MLKYNEYEALEHLLTKKEPMFIGKHRGYEVFMDIDGFYVNGLNGLGQPKKIYRPTCSELCEWIDESVAAWLHVTPKR